MKRKPKLIQYAGGDYFIADILIQKLENLCQNKCTFVEAFGGSGYISQNVPREKFTNIIYNDIDSKLTKLYEQIKNNPEKLKIILEFMPFSNEIRKIANDLLENKYLSDLEIAILEFYTLNSSFFGQRSYGFAVTKIPSRSYAKSFSNKIKDIYEISKAWRDITIENRDYKEIIKIYDSSNTVFYLDPPFIGDIGSRYDYHFSINDLKEMTNLLQKLKGKFLLKLNKENYEIVKDKLGKFTIEELERTRMQKKKFGEKRDKWILVLVHN